MTKDKALKLALEALEKIALAGMSGTGQESDEAMTAWHARQAWSFIGIAARALEPIKEALAKPEQEPVAWQWLGSAHFRKKIPKNADITAWSPVYSAPQRTWVGLTDEEISSIWDDHVVPVFGKNGINPIVFAKDIEAKLKELNT